jgi:hypothetical protein
VIPTITLTPVSATEMATSANYTTDGTWAYVKNDVITIAFPANGQKPMFLWWYTEDPTNVNVVKFKGLIEYTTFEKPYFLWRCQAEAWRITERLQAFYYNPRQHMLGEMLKAKALQALGKISNYIGLHAPYLPFGGAKWRLDGPTNVTKGDVKYLSFNFTLEDVPGYRPNLQFAENNVIIRCRFYYTPATEDVYGKYSYTVDAGELKIDIIIKNWEWNIDKLEPIIQELRDLGFDVPKAKAGLALWINLASINMTQMGIAANDAASAEDVDLTEGVSGAQNMYVEGDKVSVVQNISEQSDEMPLQNRWRERFQIRFEKGNASFAGFFKFVPQAIITDGITYNTTDVTAAYISAGRHMRLFIGYPYFGNNTLEHDPSLGVQSIAPWLPTGLLTILLGATITIAVAVAAIRLRKKTINIVNVQ